MAKQFILGIDIGTSGCKSLLIDDRGRGGATSFRSRDFRSALVDQPAHILRKINLPIFLLGK